MPHKIHKHSVRRTAAGKYAKGANSFDECVGERETRKECRRNGCEAERLYEEHNNLLYTEMHIYL